MGASASGISDPFDGINFFGAHFVNAAVGTIVGEDGIILRTTDGGNNWVQQTSGTTDCFMPSTSAMKIMASLSASSTEKLSGQPMADKTGLLRDSQTSGLLGVYFTDANTGTVVGNDGVILRTTDGGAELGSPNKRNNQPTSGCLL